MQVIRVKKKFLIIVTRPEMKVQEEVWSPRFFRSECLEMRAKQVSGSKKFAGSSLRILPHHQRSQLSDLLAPGAFPSISSFTLHQASLCCAPSTDTNLILGGCSG